MFKNLAQHICASGLHVINEFADAHAESCGAPYLIRVVERRLADDHVRKILAQPDPSRGMVMTIIPQLSHFESRLGRQLALTRRRAVRRIWHLLITIHGLPPLVAPSLLTQKGQVDSCASVTQIKTRPCLRDGRGLFGLRTVIVTVAVYWGSEFDAFASPYNLSAPGMRVFALNSENNRDEYSTPRITAISR